MNTCTMMRPTVAQLIQRGYSESRAKAIAAIKLPDGIRRQEPSTADNAAMAARINELKRTGMSANLAKFAAGLKLPVGVRRAS